MLTSLGKEAAMPVLPVGRAGGPPVWAYKGIATAVNTNVNTPVLIVLCGGIGFLLRNIVACWKVGR
jgi:hypothetical protein